MINKIITIGVLLLILPGFAFSKSNNAVVSETIRDVTNPILNSWTGENVDVPWSINGNTVSDMFGNKVELKGYNNIVITSAGAVETIYLIGGEKSVKAIGTSRSAIYPEDKTSQLPTIGNLAKPNFEEIIAMTPDLIILNGMNTQLSKDIQNLDIPVIIHTAGNIADIQNSTLVLGIFTNSIKAAEELVVENKVKVTKIKAMLEKKPLNLKGAFLFSIGPIQAFKEDTLPGEIFSILGVENIAQGVETERPILTPEYILKENPDFIFGAMSIRNAEDIIEADPVIKMVRAGKENNIIIIPSAFILRPSPRIFDELSNFYDLIDKIR